MHLGDWEPVEFVKDRCNVVDSAIVQCSQTGVIYLQVMRFARRFHYFILLLFYYTRVQHDSPMKGLQLNHSSFNQYMTF